MTQNFLRILFLSMFWMAALSPLKAQELLDQPTLGGVEGGIPGILKTRKPKSPIKYWIAVYRNMSLQPDTPTHVLLTSHGSGVGTLFQDSAASRGKKYAEVFPNDQILLIIVNEMDGRGNAALLESWGYHVVAERYQALSVELLLQELQPIRKIASLDFYGHSNDYNGAILDADFIGDDSDEVAVLQGQFTPTAWASIHGCNSAWTLAPALANFWGIPVSGAFTGTHFQRLHSTGYFFPYDQILAPSGPFADHNPYSFKQDVDCMTSGCTRMHPDNIPYNGMWGKRASGLGFAKFFCGPVATAECRKRMAVSLLGYLGLANLNLNSSASDFLFVLKESMCPISAYRNSFAECYQGIDQALRSGNETYTPFLGKSPICNANSCRDPKKNEVSKEFMRSLKDYLRGFQLLKKELQKGHLS